MNYFFLFLSFWLQVQ